MDAAVMTVLTSVTLAVPKRQITFAAFRLEITVPNAMMTVM